MERRDIQVQIRNYLSFRNGSLLDLAEKGFYVAKPTIQIYLRELRNLNNEVINNTCISRKDMFDICHLIRKSYQSWQIRVTDYLKDEELCKVFPSWLQSIPSCNG